MEHYLFASGAAACACLVLRASRATRNRDDRRRHTTDPPIDHIASAAVDLVDALRGQGERFAFTGRVLHYDCQSGALLEVLRGTHGVAGLYGVGTEKEKVRAGRARYPRLQLLHANATNRPPRGAFPFRDAFFDAVVVGVGTEGVRGADRKLLFPELSRLLRGGGRLIVIDVGAGSRGVVKEKAEAAVVAVLAAGTRTAVEAVNVLVGALAMARVGVGKEVVWGRRWWSRRSVGSPGGHPGDRADSRPRGARSLTPCFENNTPRSRRRKRRQPPASHLSTCLSRCSQ